MNKFLPFLLLTLLMSACTQTNKSLEKIFTKETALKSQLTNISGDDILEPVYVLCNEDYLITSNYGTKKNLRIYNLNDGSVVNDLLYIGRGANEILSVFGLYARNDSLLVFDPNSSNLVSLAFDDLDEENPDIVIHPFDANRFGDISPVSTRNWVATRAAFTAVDNENQFFVIDESGNIEESFDYFPDNKIKDESLHEKAMGFQGRIVANPNGESFVFGSSFGTILKFFSSENGKDFKKTKEYIFELPKYSTTYEPTKERLGVTWDDECKIGARGMAGNEDYCFVLANNTRFAEKKWDANTVYVFDWQGEPVTKLVLDVFVSTIVYEKSNNALIGLGTDDSGDYKFYSFPLSALI